MFIRWKNISPSFRARMKLPPRGGAHGAIKLYLLLYTTCTRVQTVPYNPYSCTGEMTPSIQVYTPDGSTRTAVLEYSPYHYRCTGVRPVQCVPHTTAVRTIRDAQLYAPYHPACAPVLG